MSYILDALRKLETERGQPASLAGATAPPARAPGAARLVIVGLLAVNTGLVGYWLYERTVTPTVVPEAAQPQVDHRRIAAAPARSTPVRAPAPPRSAKPTRVSLNALPAIDRGAFSGMMFSTHVYADEPEFRAVFINGKRHTEGDRVAAEVTLHRITEAGVELAYRDYLVEIDLLQEWE